MNNKGISIISLIITIILIVVLAGIAISGNTQSLEEANKAKFQNDLKAVVEAVDVYNERAMIRGIASYDADDLTWDGVSEKAENTAKIKDSNHEEEDSIRDILDGNDVPKSLKGYITIEDGRVMFDKTKKPEIEWATEIYSYMGE